MHSIETASWLVRRLSSEQTVSVQSRLERISQQCWWSSAWSEKTSLSSNLALCNGCKRHLSNVSTPLLEQALRVMRVTRCTVLCRTCSVIAEWQECLADHTYHSTPTSTGRPAYNGSAPRITCVSYHSTSFLSASGCDSIFAHHAIAMHAWQAEPILSFPETCSVLKCRTLIKATLFSHSPHGLDYLCGDTGSCFQ